MPSRGDLSESIAAERLRASGLHILVRNFTARTGEIDIVALDRACLVFVEVRARSNPHYGGAAASVDRHKQRRLVRTARLFLQANPQWADHACRFDVVAFEPRQSATEPQLNWIRGAFTAPAW